VGGGTPSSQFIATVERTDYSNDLINPSIRGSLSSGRYNFYASSTENFGFLSGGRGAGIIPERIDFSNDTARPIVITPGNGNHTGSSVGNNNFGYYAGGTNSPGFSNWLSNIVRIDYSNTSVGAISRRFLSSAKQAAAGVGNNNFGYFGGGSTPSDISTVDRISYNNDSVGTLIRGPLSVAKNLLSATGNSNFGYFGGGSPLTSIVERIDYSNDTATAIFRTNLLQSKSGVSGFGNSNFGYFGGGGVFGGLSSNLDRVDYSNDSVSLRGRLSIIKSRAAGLSNARNA
jgi:hypothetical protein